MRSPQSIVVVVVVAHVLYTALHCVQIQRLLPHVLLPERPLHSAALWKHGPPARDDPRQGGEPIGETAAGQQGWGGGRRGGAVTIRNGFNGSELDLATC